LCAGKAAEFIVPFDREHSAAAPKVNAGGTLKLIDCHAFFAFVIGDGDTAASHSARKLRIIQAFPASIPSVPKAGR
jgi:hypothetical protein